MPTSGTTVAPRALCCPTAPPCPGRAGTRGDGVRAAVRAAQLLLLAAHQRPARGVPSRRPRGRAAGDRPRFSASRLWETAAAESVTALTSWARSARYCCTGRTARRTVRTRSPGRTADRRGLDGARHGPAASASSSGRPTPAPSWGTSPTSGRQFARAPPVARSVTTTPRDRRGRAPTAERSRPRVSPSGHRAEHLTFTGYVGDPEATATARRDDWFHTGDRGRIEDGSAVVRGPVRGRDPRRGSTSAPPRWKCRRVPARGGGGGGGWRVLRAD